MHPTEALLAAVIYPLVTGVFLSGTNPTLEEMSPFMYSISGISFTRWATEGLTVLEMQQEEEHNVRPRRVLGELAIHEICHRDFNTRRRGSFARRLVIAGGVVLLFCMFCARDVA